MNLENLKKLTKKVDEFKKAYTDSESKVKDKIVVLQKIGAGVQERMNWQLLHQYINMSTPQPNGDHLVVRSKNLAEVKKKFWNDAAKKAYKDLEEARFSKATIDPAEVKKRDLEIKRNLIQINIAGINALYTDE